MANTGIQNPLQSDSDAEEARINQILLNKPSLSELMSLNNDMQTEFGTLSALVADVRQGKLEKLLPFIKFSHLPMVELDANDKHARQTLADSRHLNGSKHFVTFPMEGESPEAVLAIQKARLKELFGEHADAMIGHTKDGKAVIMTVGVSLDEEHAAYELSRQKNKAEIAVRVIGHDIKKISSLSLDGTSEPTPNHTDSLSPHLLTPRPAVTDKDSVINR